MADGSLSQARSLRDIPALRQLALLVGIAAAVAAGISIFMWAQKPGMTPLYANLSSKDAAEVTEALRAANIEYALDDASGAVTQASAANRATRAWQLDAHPRGDFAGHRSWLRIALLLVQGVGIVLVVVLCLPTLERRRRR